MIVETKLVKVIWGKYSNAAAIFPFVFIIPFNAYIVKNKLLEATDREQLKRYSSTLNHERIHLRQQIELLWVFFVILYSLDYVRIFIRQLRQGGKLNKSTVYQRICFEREAYANSKNTDYLKTRKFWSFIKYYY